MCLWRLWAFSGDRDPVLGWWIVPSFDDWDLDQLRLFEKVWGGTKNKEPSAEVTGLVPVPIPGTLSSENPAPM